LSEKKAARIDQELVKALAHPIRVQILEALQERVASPTELSKEMEESLGVVSYHANTLVGCGCLELVRTQPRRGALEHFYRATPRSFIGHQDWRRAPRSVLGGVTSAAVGTFVDQAAAAIEAGTIDARDDTTLNWMPITVDDTGWEELAEAMGEVQRLATGIHARSVRRLGGGEGTAVIVGLAGFEAGRVPPAAADPGD
jgi:DNA-binding transcriptional ArsR family regulator